MTKKVTKPIDKPTRKVTKPIDKPTRKVTKPIDKPTRNVTQPIYEPARKVMQPSDKPTSKPEEVLGIRSILERAYQDGADRYRVQWEKDNEESWELVSSIADFDIAKNFERAREEAAAKDETVYSSPGNDDDVEMESVPKNGSEKAGGNADSSPMTQAGEDDGRLHNLHKESGQLNLEAMYRDQHLVDCTIKVTRDGTEFRAHKLLLAYGSERFFKEFIEERADDVTIDDCSSLAVRTLLDSIYGRDLDVVVVDECAAELLPLADEYKIMALKALAASRLLLQVDPGNVLMLARLAFSHNAPELMQACASVLDANRHGIFKTTAWRELLMGSTEVAADLLKLC